MKCKLREKQLRKKIKKTKKGLTLAATALILNGSLMPINNVFANEQSKDSTTAVSSEKVETNFLKSEIPNVNLQNNTEKEQATQSSIITNENSSNVQGEDKEKVTEGKSDVDLQNSTEKEQATQNSIITNENSSNVQGEDKEKVTEDKSDELKIVRSTRLSDGRIAKDISTPDQLQEAFYDATIGQVNLVSDITLTKNILMDSQKNPQLVINGNNHILDFGLFSITTTGSRDQYDRNINVKLMNLQTRNGGGWGAVTPYDGVVELENINHEGTTLVNSRGMRLSGKINCMVNKPSQEGGLSTYWAKSPENYITISSGADVVVDQSLATGCQFTAINAKALNLEENSKLTVRTPLWQKWGVICIDREGKVDVGKGAQLNVETSADCPAISFYRSSLELRVANGGEINARSAGDYAITMDAANSIVNLSGAKFNIQSTKANGVPLFMAAGSTVSFDNQNVRAWLKGSATSTNPRYSWDNVSGVVNMSGATTTSVSSYNTDFQSSFKNQNFSRISSNGTAKQELTKTTINEVKDTDTTVSGKGEPNAPIMIKVGDQPIGNGTVDSEGNYSVPIQKQSAGTNIKAVVTKDGLSSEASTTVTKSSLIPTTISNITTETTQVSGKAEPNATIKLKVGDTTLREGTVGTDGLYSFTIPKQKAGTVVKVIVEKDKLTSEASTVVVRGELDPTTISQIDTTMTSVSGKAEPNATIKLKVGDTTLREGTVGTDGLYSFTIPKQKAGTVVKVIVKKDKLTSEASTVVKLIANATITKVDEYKQGESSKVTGTYTGAGAKYIRLFINGGKKDIYSRDNQEAGKFSYYTDELKASDKVEVVLFDANFKELARKNVPIVAPDPIVITKVDTYTEGISTFVKGTYSGKGVKYIDVVVNDDEKMSYQLSKDQKPGTFQYYTGNLNLKATDDVKVRLYNSDRKVVAQKQVPIEARSSVTITGVEKYIVGDSMSVSGTYEGEGVAKIKLVVNGIDKMAYPLHTLRTFSYYYNELKATDNVKIVLLDSNSRVLAEAKVTVEDESPSNVSITSVNEYIEGKTEYVSGLYKGEDVISANLIINGTPINKVWLEKEPKGTFKYYERNLKVTDDVQIVLYNKKGKEVARKQVVIKEKKVKE